MIRGRLALEGLVLEIFEIKVEKMEKIAKKVEIRTGLILTVLDQITNPLDTIGFPPSSFDRYTFQKV